jgi:CheY-like chemotaxis protein
VAQILAFGRPAERDRETLDLGSVISETLQMLHSTLPPEVVAAAEIDPKAPAVMGDRTQLTQIVMNLAVNARDAIGAGPGRIALSVAPPGPETWPARSDAGPGLRLETGADGTARLWTGQLPTGPLVAVTVSDSGCGMPSDVLQSIFEPFFTTKRRGEGTGLGLAAVHGLVSGHGGAIAVATRPGAGTAFTVVLPAAPAAAPELPPAHAAGVEAAPVQVLVVDDEDGIRGMLATALRRRGFTALTAADAASALETLERERVDAVISDQHMPGMSGLALLKRVRANRPDLPFVLCTGFSDTLDSATATAAGANAFLQKPVAAQQLIAVLADALRRS